MGQGQRLVASLFLLVRVGDRGNVDRMLLKEPLSLLT
jgi:hypothetical protein